MSMLTPEILNTEHAQLAVFALAGVQKFVRFAPNFCTHGETRSSMAEEEEWFVFKLLQETAAKPWSFMHFQLEGI